MKVLSGAGISVRTLDGHAGEHQLWEHCLGESIIGAYGTSGPTPILTAPSGRLKKRVSDAPSVSRPIPCINLLASTFG